jgi:hypothetical protein
MNQLDKHYMISEVDGKKCSANMVAQIVDEILGLTGTEKLINDISIDGKRAKKEAKKNDEQIEMLGERIHDKEMIKDKKLLLSESQLLLSNYLKIEERLDSIKRFHRKHKELNDKLDVVSEKMKSYKNLEGIKEAFQKLTDKNALYKSYREILDKEAVLRARINSCDLKINSSLDFTTLIVKKTKLANLYKKSQDMSVFLDGYMAKKSKLDSVVGRIKIASVELSNAKIEWDNFRKENPNCPTCGAVLKNELCC